VARREEIKEEALRHPHVTFEQALFVMGQRVEGINVARAFRILRSHTWTLRWAKAREVLQRLKVVLDRVSARPRSDAMIRGSQKSTCTDLALLYGGGDGQPGGQVYDRHHALDVRHRGHTVDPLKDPELIESLPGWRWLDFHEWLNDATPHWDDAAEEAAKAGETTGGVTIPPLHERWGEPYTVNPSAPAPLQVRRCDLVPLTPAQVKLVDDTVAAGGEDPSFIPACCVEGRHFFATGSTGGGLVHWAFERLRRHR
jgi:hypothetical protein